MRSPAQTSGRYGPGHTGRPPWLLPAGGRPPPSQTERYPAGRRPRTGRCSPRRGIPPHPGRTDGCCRCRCGPPVHRRRNKSCWRPPTCPDPPSVPPAPRGRPTWGSWRYKRRSWRGRLLPGYPDPDFGTARSQMRSPPHCHSGRSDLPSGGPGWPRRTDSGNIGRSPRPGNIPPHRPAIPSGSCGAPRRSDRCLLRSASPPAPAWAVPPESRRRSPAR